MIDNVKNCTGCSACESVCKQNAIRMEYNEEGFLYPKINLDNCLNCGKCDHVCPTISRKRITYSDEYPKAYGAINKNTEELLRSSSGGLFILLAKEILSRNGVIAGAAFSDDFQYVKHVIVDDEENLNQLLGSKYLQSDTRNIFPIIKIILESERYVLFSGTPCQIVALKNFLQKDYYNLLCVDVICHGAPSPFVWQKYLCYVINEFNLTPRYISHRYKMNSWDSFGIRINDNERFYFRDLNQDPYLKLFLNNYSLRESCFDCCAKGEYRQSDITLGDFWGAENFGFADNSDGVSLVIVHNQKGLEFFSSLADSVLSIPVNCSDAIKYNSAYEFSVNPPEKRKEFFADMNKISWDGLFKRYNRVETKKVIKNKISASFIGMIWRTFRQRNAKYMGGVKRNLQINYGIMIIFK